jgi:hypothetical protein
MTAMPSATSYLRDMLADYYEPKMLALIDSFGYRSVHQHRATEGPQKCAD